jgi:DNA-binding protein H-NS
MATYQELKTKISKLEEQAKALLKKESAGVITKIRGLMSEYGLTVQDLGLGITNMGKKMSAMKNPLPPKYQDPVSGKTWSGKGKAPGWIVEATKKGKREDFLIGKAAAKPEVKKAAPAKKTAPKKAVAAKPVAKKTAPSAKPAAKATAKPAAKPTAPKAAVAKKAAPKAKPAPKAAVTAPTATPAAKA